MLDILDAHMSRSAPEALKDAVERAHNVFERIELPEYEQHFEQILLLSDDDDDSEAVRQIVELTRTLQDQILSEHLIKLAQDSDLDMRTQFIEALLLLPEYEDRSVIQRTLMLGVSSEELMAELCQLVTPHNASEWLTVIEEVSDSLIDKLRQITRERVSVEGSGIAGQARAKRLDALIKLGAVVDQTQFETIGLIQQGVDLGYPFNTYATRLGPQLEGLGVDKAAYEFVAMCLVSEDGFDDPLSMTKQHLESYISTPDLATKILVKVSQIVLAMQQSQATLGAVA